MIEAVMTMTELVTRNTDRPKRRNGAAKRDKVHMVADDIVSPNGNWRRISA